MIIRNALVAIMLTFAVPGTASDQDPAKLVTKAEVEKVTGAKFKDGWVPMPGQIMFQEADGDLQISVDLETREAGSTVRGWEATMKKMQPTIRVETVSGLGSDAIFYSTRPDLGKVSADFEKPRVQMSVSVSGAKSPVQARQIVIDLARLAGPRVGKP